MLKQYKEYREINRVLNNKIIKFMKGLKERPIYIAAKHLNLLKHNNIELERKEEASILMDFAINDCKIEGNNVIALYRQYEEIKDEERDLLEAMQSAKTSLFRVEEISNIECRLRLTDLLNKNIVIEIIDIGFSQSVRPGYLLFARILRCEKFNMTSGVSFVFNKSESKILMQYEQIISKSNIENIDIQRFAAFFKINRKEGVNVNFI